MGKIIKFLGAVCLILVVVLVYLIKEKDLLSKPTQMTEQTEPLTERQEPVDQAVQQRVIPEEVHYTYEERMERGQYYATNAFLSLAVNEYTKASQINPEAAEPYYRIGKSQMLLEDFEKAKENTNKALEIDPGNNEYLICLTRIYLKQKAFEQARQTLQKGDSSNVEVMFYLALLEMVANDTDSAKGRLEKIRETSQDTGLNEKVINLLNSYEEYTLFKGGKPIHLKTLLARSLNQIKEYEIALVVLKEVLKEKTDYRDAWILSGYAYLNLEKYDYALDSFRNAYDLDSEKPETQYFLGLTYFELGKTEDALTYLNIALKNGFEPQIQVKQKLGDIYFEQKDYAQAVQMYEEVLKLNNNEVGTFIKPIWMYLDFLNDPDKALELAQAAYKKHPESAMTFNLLAWSHLGKEEYLKAEEYLKKAIEREPNMQAAWYNLGRVYAGLLNREKALEHFQKAYEMGKDTSIGNMAAKSYNELYSE